MRWSLHGQPDRGETGRRLRRRSRDRAPSCPGDAPPVRRARTAGLHTRLARLEVTAIERVLTLRVLGRGIRVRCAESMTYSLVTAAYGEMQDDASTIDLDYTVGKNGADAGFYIA